MEQKFICIIYKPYNQTLWCTWIFTISDLYQFFPSFSLWISFLAILSSYRVRTLLHRKNNSAYFLLLVLTDSFKAFPPLHLLPQCSQPLSCHLHIMLHLLYPLCLSPKDSGQPCLWWSLSSSKFTQPSCSNDSLFTPAHRCTFPKWCSCPFLCHSYWEGNPCQIFFQFSMQKGHFDIRKIQKLPSNSVQKKMFFMI